MDLKLLLSPAQKDPEEAQSSARGDDTRDGRPSWQNQQPQQQHSRGPYVPPQQHYYSHQGDSIRPAAPIENQTLHHHPRADPGSLYHQHALSFADEDRGHLISRTMPPAGDLTLQRPALVPPIVSISASTPLPGEAPQAPQYFVPTHHSHTPPPPPPAVPPPTGLNLSSYSFLLMEKRDRERDAMERANRGYLAGEKTTTGRIDDRPPTSSAHQSPRLDSPQTHAQKTTSSQPGYSGPSPHPQYDQKEYPKEPAAPYGYGASSYGPHDFAFGYGSAPRHSPSDMHPYPLGYSAPPHHSYGYMPEGLHHHHASPYPHHQHFHSNSSTNIGVDPYGRPQDYTPEIQATSPPTPLHNQPHLHQYRSMSPSLLDRPRFANSNLSVFRQNAAEDSDGNASVSSSGSHKRRRRPNKTIDGKKTLLPSSALGASSGSMGHYLSARASSPGSGDGQDYYDGDDSSDEQLDVRTGLQGLNLQRSTKPSAADRTKKLRVKMERPFKIGELVESMKSDTSGTWYAARVLDLEDDPHDHINPKSVLVHFEGFSPHHDEWVKPNQLRTCSTGSGFLRYGPMGQESPDNWAAYEKFYHSELGRTARRHTGLAYDRRMLLHKCLCNTNPEEKHHPEQPERLVEILCQFQKHGMLSLVKWIQGREATIEELMAAHAETHVRNYCCTDAENRQYAKEHGLATSDADVESGEEDADVEESAKPNEDGSPEEGKGEIERRPSVTKVPGRRGRPRKGARGSILVPTTATTATPEAIAAAAAVAAASKASDPPDASTSDDVEMANAETIKTMDVDLHSPALNRRRSSMRGAGVRMSSLVSMSSTLFAQTEEEMSEEAAKTLHQIEDEDDDEDEKMGEAGPAPSEAALAVAGGMDPSLASQLTNSPTMIPKVEAKEEPTTVAKDAEEILEEDKDIPDLDLDKTKSHSNSQATSTEAVKATDDATNQDPTESVLSNAEPSESTETKDGLAQETESIGEKEAMEVSPSEPTAPTTRSKEKEKEREKKAAEKSEKQAQKEVGTPRTPIKKKGHQAVSPAPMPANEDSHINPPGQTYTMSCGQLGIAVDTTWNPYHSSTAAKVAAGCLITLVDQVVTGRCKNGFAIIRPPGHHAEEDEAMGFCFFNNVGVAVNLTLTKYPLTVQKILIIDWDVHHGNGTQQIFYENPNVLYISLHRWDNGHFYPFTGAPDECGEEAGEGKNVNLAWSSYGRGQAMGDVEYIAAFWYVLLPIARQFGPDLVIVSAGFDAADGHASNIGGYTVSPQGFAILTRLVQTLAGGRVILSLEGGYEFEPLANSATACLEELLPHSLLPATAPTRAFPYASFHGTLNSVKPNAMAVSSLHQVLKYQQKYWKFPPEVLNPNFRFQLPAEWKASNSLATRPRRERNTRRRAPVLDS
ncbi:Histone deacetylase 5 [Lunasporangiospora selenospora]|uniref:histone deacetylase n=1 Tax=Lunasporangiospora selenospora TaxID=979761 RepID=A0A9P6G1R1_9FUNG|nr:Histone deacetylase 5 [Lunasporangiospora selenospora]